jgi:hypothetical protein
MDRVAPGHHGGAGRRAGRLGVHAHKRKSLVRELRNSGRAVAADDIEVRHADFTEANIIEQDVNDVRRLAAVLGADFGQPGVNRLVFFGPPFAVLRCKNVVLGIVDDVTFRGRIGTLRK